MDPLAKKIGELKETEYPEGLHGRIMGTINALKFRAGFIVVISLLFLNFLITGTFFTIRFLDNNAPALISFMIREFDASTSYFSQFLGVLYDTIPPGLFFALIINVILTVYIIRIYSYLRKEAGRSFLKQEVKIS